MCKNFKSSIIWILLSLSVLGGAENVFAFAIPKLPPGCSGNTYQTNKNFLKGGEDFWVNLRACLRPSPGCLEKAKNFAEDPFELDDNTLAILRTCITKFLKKKSSVSPYLLGKISLGTSKSPFWFGSIREGYKLTKQDLNQLGIQETRGEVNLVDPVEKMPRFAKEQRKFIGDEEHYLIVEHPLGLKDYEKMGILEMNGIYSGPI